MRLGKGQRHCLPPSLRTRQLVLGTDMERTEEELKGTGRPRVWMWASSVWVQVSHQEEVFQWALRESGTKASTSVSTRTLSSAQVFPNILSCGCPMVLGGREPWHSPSPQSMFPSLKPNPGLRFSFTANKLSESFLRAD